MPWLELAKLAGSLAAILALAAFARWLQLGHDLRLRDAEHAKELANEAVYCFHATDVALDKAGIGALLRDAQGRQMLLRRHGAMWAGRLLDSNVEARLDRDFLTIGTGEKTFGAVTLHLGEAAQIWAAGLRRVPNA